MSEETALVYAGKGSSHSWVWLADLLEANGVYDARFVNAADFAQGLEDSPSVAVVSGGDGLEIASSLSGKGFEALKEFIGGGGTYFGICAGAYLPLPSRIEPFSGLNLSETRIRNIRDGSAGPPGPSPRVAVRYGSCSVFHPVRGEIMIGDGACTLIAPLYGGPVFSEPTVDHPILRYLSFTSRTSFQVDRRIAEETMIGQPAVVRCDFENGQLILAGPHLEYPGCHEGNDLFMRLAGLSVRGRSRRITSGRPFETRSLCRSLADLKVAILGMERESFILGSKQWDGSRLLELTKAIERRRDSLDGDSAQAVSDLLDRSREDLMSSGPGRVSDSESAPELLVEAARLTVDRHFRA